MYHSYLFTYRPGQHRLEQGRYFRLYNLLLLLLSTQALADGHAGCDCPRQDSGKNERSSEHTFLPDPSVDWSMKRCSSSLDQLNWTDQRLLGGGLGLGPNGYCFFRASNADGSGYAGSTAWNNAVRNRLVLEQSEKGSRRVLRVAKANYGGAAELELFAFGSTFTTAAESNQDEREAEERDAVLNTTLKLLDQGVQIVRSNGSGQKPADLAREVKEKDALALAPKRVLEILNTLERQGKLKYRSATNQKRGVRTGFYRPEG